jgi:PhoPQ-activated pathogenicity-related protein
MQASSATNTSSGKTLPDNTAPDVALRTPLDDYIARPEPLYKWEKTGEQGNTTILRLTSQEWQGVTWRHRVEITRPERLEFPDTAIVMLSYGHGRPEETRAAQFGANATGATIVNVFDVPNQPIFGMQEDDLIAHTFEKYLETGDATWPLLLPMTKSAIKTMDAVTEYTQRDWEQPVNRYIVTGASKRGWTSWLAAAADNARPEVNKKRVIAIVPGVYDNLNLPRQLPHQLEVWGEYSGMISDYTRRGLQEQMNTPAGHALLGIVDPWTYRSRFTLPKLILNAANDEYWAVDALNLYRDGLPGKTDVRYVPNAGHRMTGREVEVYRGVATWLRKVAAGHVTPKVELLAENIAGSGRYLLRADEPAQRASLWVARSATRDFRKARWDEVPMVASNNDSPIPPAGTKVQFEVRLSAPPPETPYVAVFADAIFEGKPAPLTLSSSVIISGSP